MRKGSKIRYNRRRYGNGYAFAITFSTGEFSRAPSGFWDMEV